MTTITVKDSAGLVSALKAAKAGDVVQLEAGNYAPVTLSGLRFDGVVTVTSQDPAAMAVMNGMTVKSCDGLVFKNLDMNAPGTTAYSYHVTASSNVTFDGVKIHGSLDGDISNDRSGLQIRDSFNVTVTNSEFQQLNNGISHLNNDGLKFTNNYIHEISEDGIRGGGSSNVIVSDNYFTDFERRSVGDHPDAIQFWTTNTTESARNITVTGNVIVRGDGDPIQGVFFRDQVGNLPYENVTIAGNLVVGGLVQGIGVNGGRNVLITDNIVVGLSDQRSSILTQDVVGTVSNNQGTHYAVDTGATQSNNRLIEAPRDGGLAIQQAWLASRGELAVVAGAFKFASLNDGFITGVLDATKLTAAVLDAAANAAIRNIDDTRANALRITGTSGADKLSVDGKRDTVIDAGDGDDVLTGGGAGHNTLIGGRGDDNYNVKSVYDIVVEAAGGGNDQVTAYVDHTLADNVERLRLVGEARYGAGNALDNKITGSAGDDELRGLGGDDHLGGGADGADRLYGGDGNDTLGGGLGNDTLSGDTGNDKLSGDEGDDSLSGGAGADTLEGGAGRDTMSGGEGADVFVFRNGDLDMAGDRITDFSHAEGDRISLRAIDANTNVAGDQNFKFIGTSGFSKVAGELRFEVVGGETHVYGDVNGDGQADFQLVLPGAGTLVAGDFVL